VACNIALKINPSWLMLDLDSKNTHTFCSMDWLEEKLELNVAFHYILESFRSMYAKTVTVCGISVRARIDQARASTCLVRDLDKGTL